MLAGQRSVDGKRDLQAGSLLGPGYSAEELEEFVIREGIRASRHDELGELAERVAELEARVAELAGGSGGGDSSLNGPAAHAENANAR